MKQSAHYLALLRVKLSSPSRSLRTLRIAWQVLRHEGRQALQERLEASKSMYAGCSEHDESSTWVNSFDDPAGQPLKYPAVPIHAEPLVSMIIPVFNNLSYTAACVEAVTQCAGNVPYEIIVADDGSNDGTAEWCGSVPHLPLPRDHRPARRWRGRRCS